MFISALHQEVQLRAIEGSIVIDPASYHRIDFHGESGKVRSTAPVEM